MNNNLIPIFEDHHKSIDSLSSEYTVRKCEYYKGRIGMGNNDKIEQIWPINELDLPPDNFKPPRPRDPFRPIPNLPEFRSYSSTETFGELLSSRNFHENDHIFDANTIIHFTSNLGD